MPKDPNCNVGSAVRLVKQGGELVAIPHYVKPSGYKAPNAYGAKAIFTGDTTNDFYQGKVRKVGENNDSNKKLMPYYPNAPRNRPAETMENHPGQRFGLKVTRDTQETYRGSSQINFNDGDPDSSRPWKTTNQLYAECAQGVDKPGLANQGISSDLAKGMHAKQRR